MGKTTMSSDHLRLAEEPKALALVNYPPLTRSTLDRTPEAPLAPRVEVLTPLQKDSALRASQALDNAPHCFFLGHGPGVGKTRILAAVAREHELSAGFSEILWVVPNAALKKQAQAEMKVLGVSLATCHVASYAQLRMQADASARRGSLLILDEAHMLRNECTTSGRINLLQDRFRCVVYSTATAASCISRLSYMKRLELWGAGTPFEDFSEFARAFKRWGPAASEMLALDLKQKGLYTCHKLPAPPLRTLTVIPDSKERRCFDACCKAWKDSPSHHCSNRNAFFQRLVTSLKAQILLPRWQKDLSNGFSLVIVLQGTGAASFKKEASMLERICRRDGIRPPEDMPEDALNIIRAGLYPEKVGEISGRPVPMRQPRRTQERDDGDEGGACHDSIGGNSKELAAFQMGESRVLAMTAAGSLGLNITSTRPIKMYILELPWTPECLAQQLGRCNRLNSIMPECFKVNMDTFVEKRVEASLETRSETLGALSCADRMEGALHTLPWGSKLMRAVTLEMTVRLLVARLPKDVVRQISQEAEAYPRLNPREAVLARIRNSTLLLGDSEQLRENLEIVLAADPSLAGLLTEGWSPDSHSMFLPRQQKLIWTAALAMNRHGLPSSLLSNVLAFSFGSEWDVETTLRWLPEVFLDSKTHASLFSEASAMPLALQQRLLQSCEEISERISPKRQRIMTALDFCVSKGFGIPKGFSFDVQILRGRCVGERLVTVKTRNSVSPVEKPILFCLTSGHIVHLGDCVACSPGRPPMSSRKAQELKTKTWVGVDARSRFASLESKHIHLRNRAAQGMSKILRMRFENPLLHWEESLRQVLSVDASPDEAKFVGLLMEVGQA